MKKIFAAIAGSGLVLCSIGCIDPVDEDAGHYTGIDVQTLIMPLIHISEKETEMEQRPAPKVKNIRSQISTNKPGSIKKIENGERDDQVLNGKFHKMFCHCEARSNLNLIIRDCFLDPRRNDKHSIRAFVARSS